MPKKYRKKPVIVEAVRHLPENTLEMYQFITNNPKATDTDIKNRGDNFYIDFCNGACQLGDLIIKTLDGDMRCNLGDWIIKGVRGEFYPCNPDVFEKVYEEINYDRH